MGANFFFNKMLPAVQQEGQFTKEPKRQLEVFTHGGKTFIRVGPVNQEDSGINRYTVEIPQEDVQDIASAFILLAK